MNPHQFWATLLVVLFHAILLPDECLGFGVSVMMNRYGSNRIIGHSTRMQMQVNAGEAMNRTEARLPTLGNDSVVEDGLEQYEKLQQLETRLKRLQEEQQEKEEKYQQRIRNVMEEMDKKEKDLLGKVQNFANQLQQYRFDLQNTLRVSKEASQKKEEQLQDEIRGLRSRVQELELENNQAKALTKELTEIRDQLEEKLKEIERKHASETGFE